MKNVFNFKFASIFIVLFLSLSLSVAYGQTLIINEVSQGPSGSKEYVEFLVIPTGAINPCQPIANCLDMRGWIFDDNNGIFTPGSTSGVGLAQGALRFSNSAFWSCIPIGTLIVVYNEQDINASLPANDFSMNDGNCRLILPASSGLIEGNANNPSAAAPLTYTMGGWVPGGSWAYTGMANTNDSYQIYAPFATNIPAHSVSWGNNTSNTIIYFAAAATATVHYFNSSSNNPYLQNNWSSGSSPLFETPGSGNNAANTAYIQSLTNNCTPITPLAGNLSSQNAACGCTGAATAAPTGGNGTFAYAWTNSQGQAIGASSSISNLCSGWYYVQITSGACTTADSVNIQGGGVAVNPTFAAMGPYCQGAQAGALPNTSTNGITGTWSPANISTANVGNTQYTFTPNAGQCANPFNQSVVVNAIVIPNFPVFGPYCPTAQLPLLPDSSQNGIDGSWNPAIISTTLGPSTYTFTPNAGQCSDTASITITISNAVLPAFNGIGPYCQNTPGVPLPPVSDNGISGSWLPPSVNTNIAGSGQYIFAPDAGQCGDTVVIQIQVTAAALPVFPSLGPYCIGDVASLPNPSLNGINGTWSPASINTTQPGVANYTFTPNPGSCSGDTTLEITVLNPIIFAGNDTTICAGSSIFLSASGGSNYVWSNGILNGIPFTPNGSGSYVVCGSVGNCNDCDTLNVTVNPAPSASFLSEVSGNEAQFLYMGTPVTSFAWDFGDGGSSVLMDPNHTYPGPGIYGVLLIVTNQGCTSTYFAEIELIAPGSEAHLINVITPNGDGINDVFDLALEGYKEVTISIVNRWGNTMVELTGNSLTWDGTVDGKPALEGVYFYQFKALGFDGNSSQGHGFFHLKQ
jgi:gliding motility-associated-like protein